MGTADHRPDLDTRFTAVRAAGNTLRLLRAKSPASTSAPVIEAATRQLEFALRAVEPTDTALGRLLRINLDGSEAGASEVDTQPDSNAQQVTVADGRGASVWYGDCSGILLATVSASLKPIQPSRRSARCACG